MQDFELKQVENDPWVSQEFQPEVGLYPQDKHVQLAGRKPTHQPLPAYPHPHH